MATTANPTRITGRLKHSRTAPYVPLQNYFLTEQANLFNVTLRSQPWVLRITHQPNSRPSSALRAPLIRAMRVASEHGESSLRGLAPCHQRRSRSLYKLLPSRLYTARSDLRSSLLMPP